MVTPKYTRDNYTFVEKQNEGALPASMPRITDKKYSYIRMLCGMDAGDIQFNRDYAYWKRTYGIKW